MSATERIDNHAGWSSVETTREALDTLLADSEELDAAAQDLVQRGRWLLDVVKSRRALVDARAITITSLDQLHQSLAQLAQQLPNVKANPTNYVGAAHAQIDIALGAVSGWRPELAPDDELQRALRAAEDDRSLVSEILQRVRTETEALETKLTEHRGMVDKVAGSLKSLEQRVTDKSAEFTASFGDKQASRQQEFADAQTDRQSAFSDEMQRYQDEAEQLRDQFTADAQQHLTHLQEVDDQANNLLQGMGVKATASHYQKYAEQERKAADRWALGTVMAGLGAVVGLIWMLAGFHNTDDPSWSLISLKSLVGVVAVAIAGYAGREASGHRAEERHAKQRELALTAMEPFLANVPVDETNGLRIRLAQQLFATGSDDPSSPAASGAFGLATAVKERIPGIQPDS